MQLENDKLIFISYIDTIYTGKFRVLLHKFYEVNNSNESVNTYC